MIRRYLPDVDASLLSGSGERDDYVPMALKILSLARSVGHTPLLTFSDDGMRVMFVLFSEEVLLGFGPISDTTPLHLGPEDQPKLVSRHCFANSMFSSEMQCSSVCVFI